MARNYLISLIQIHTFSNKTALLRADRTLPKRNKLEILNFFIDINTEILRVGGLLSSSKLLHQ
jgi:hypothetical protein